MNRDEVEAKLIQWLHETRQSKGLDIGELSKLCGLATSMISRIENGVSAVTFNTVVRLCFGLGIDSRSFSEQLTISRIDSKRPIDPFYTSHILPPHLTILDIEAFKLAYRFDILAAQGDLIVSWKNILERRKDFHGDSFQAATTQIKNATTALSRIPLEYPSLGCFELEDIYGEHGVIALVDAGNYLREIRQDKFKTLVEFQEASQISRNILRRIENGQMERIRFSDILMLAQLFEKGDSILSMFWAAFEYHTGIEAIRVISNPDPDVIIALKEVDYAIDPYPDTLLRISRWYLRYPLEYNDRLWLDRERKKWESVALPVGLYGSTSSYDFIQIFDRVWRIFSPHLFRLCGRHQYPENAFTDYIPPEIQELWTIFLKYLVTDPIFETIKKDFLGHPDDLDFMCGLRSRFKKAWWKNDSLKNEVREYLHHYFPGILDDVE